MRRFLMAVMVIMMVAAMLAFAGGCKGKSPSSEDGAVSNSTGSSSELTPSGDEVVEDMSQASFDQLKSMWEMQITAPIASAETLRKIEAEHPDAKLKDLVAQIDKKNADLRSMLDKSTYPSGAKALQVDVPKMVGEAMELSQQATARMQEVLQAETAKKIGGG